MANLRPAIYPSLADRVVFVTGGASGIGADVVRAFGANRAKVAFCDLLDAEGKALAEEVGGLYFHCDVTDDSALVHTISETRAMLGPVSVLVNNAANDDRREIDDVTPDYWDASMAINLKPFFFAAQAVRPQMRELGGGSIINFSSISWRYGADTMSPYATAKAAINGLTKALGRGLGPDNIRVNSVEPGAVMTDRQRRLWYKTEAEVQAMVDRQAIHRVLLGEDIARLVVFLGADDSAMITKQSIIVDAGIR